MGKKVVIISCSNMKIETNGKEVRAEDLYSSPMFKKALAVAKNKKPDLIIILSAKYGALLLDDLIEYYDKYLGDMSAQERRYWSNDVINQLEDLGCDLENDTFIFLAGEKYYKDILPSLNGDNVETPLKGKRIGEILKTLNELI
ncbi:MAG: hypothetical protein HUJ68_07865 [Clostridia bacterium]|nr:hypothetical protein [Clostridia bacterium]